MMPSDLTDAASGSSSNPTEPWLIARGLEMVEHAADAIGSSLDWLRRELASHRHPVVDGSALDVAFQRCIELRRRFEIHRGPRLPPRQELRFFGDSFGIDFMSKLLHRAVLDGLDVPGRFWNALGDPCADVILTRAGTPSLSRDSVWELLLGALCKRVATAVVFDEPDVQCVFKGNTFAVAAKVSYRSKNLWTNAVAKGMSQANGRGSVGLVAVNAASIAPLARWLRICKERRFRLGPEAGAWASMKTARWCDAQLRVQLPVARYSMAPAMPTGVVFFMPILLAVADQPGPFFYLHMPATWQGERGADFEFVSALCEASKSVLDRVE